MTTPTPPPLPTPERLRKQIILNDREIANAFLKNNPGSQVEFIYDLSMGKYFIVISYPREG